MKLKSIITIAISTILMLCTASCSNDNSSDTANTSATTPSNTNTTAGTTAATTEKTKTIKIKVGSYNIKNGALVEHDFSLLADDILDNNIEIVALQEVDCNTNRNKHQDTMAILAERTKYYYCYGPSFDYDGGKYGNGILSKYPILNYEIIELPKASGSEEQRTLLHAEIDIDGEVFHFFGTHLQWAAATPLQLAEINEHTKDLDQFVVAADFNCENFELFSAVENSYLANTNYVTEPSGTKIDNFIISNNITSKNFKVTNTKNSDHYMITTEISVTFKTK